jgi:predicted NBD/HSP70 family sugar kinase
MSNIVFTKVDSSAYIGIDIGGTNTRIGLFRSLDAPDFVNIARFPTFQSYEEQLHHILDAVTASNIQFSGIGLSVAARVAKDGRSINVAPNLHNYVDRPFADDLVEALNCPVRLAHDTVCGLLAEKQFGTLNKVDRCAYVTVSTGTGAAIHLSKASTSLISSIEIGHQILDGNSLECLCGQIGCLETFTGGWQIELRYRRPIAHITDKAFWEEYSNKLAIGLINLAQLTRIDVVALSGAIVLKNQFLLLMLQEKVNATLKGSTLELKLAKLGEDAPLVGAATQFSFLEDHILH